MTAALCPSPRITDIDLVRFWSAHRENVVRYSAYLLSGDRYAAEDVAQETALRLWQNPQTLCRPGSVEGWLRTVARNIVIDRARRRAARAPESLHTPQTMVDAPTGRSAQDVAADVVGEMSYRELLDRIPEPHRTTVEAVYVRGLSVNQAAELLDVPVGTVKSRCHHGLRKLRAQLRAAGIDSPAALG